ncbi:MAG: WXG100 family type VII secretion target [Brachybacterium sp.]|uniref:WXG100 family type VII secretion target n=3 Tax=Dermabacteraceae TaxID=85020 RepID=UPI0031E8E9D9
MGTSPHRAAAPEDLVCELFTTRRGFMMTGFFGADTEQLRSHAQLLKERVGSLEDLRARLEPLVMDASSWVGTDADAFREQWSGRTAPRFDQLGDSLSRHSRDLDTHAEEQDEASEATDHSILDLLKDTLFGVGKGVIDAAKNIVLGGKKIWDVLSNMKKNPEKVLEKLRGLKGKAYDAFLKKLGMFDGLMKKAPWLTKFGKVAGKFLPGLDILAGGWQMIDSIKKGDTFHAITGGITAVGGILITAGTICDMTGVGAVVGVPLQVIGGVLVGGAMAADGIKWVVDNWDQVKDFGGDVVDGAKDLWNNTSEVISDTWNDGVDAAKDAVSDVADTVSDKVGDVADGLKNAFTW